MSVATIDQPSPNNDLVEENEEMSTQTTILNTSVVTTINSGISGDDSPPSASSVPPSIEQHCRLLEEENQTLKDSQARLQQQVSDAQRRERILMRRLANKEQEFQDYVSQIAEYKSAQAPGPAALRSALLDPAVNLLFEKLKCELQATRAKLEETQNELSAWKFTPDSNTGKRLMAKCRLLYQENEELGKMTSNGRLAKLEGELAMQKSFSEEVKKSQSELDDFLQELDEDVEGMQSTILFLQQELKATRDRIQFLEKENFQLKNGTIDEKGLHLVNGKGTLQTINERDEISDSFDSEERTLKISSNSFIVHNNNSSTVSNNILNDANYLRTNSNSNFYNGNELTNVNGVEDLSQRESVTNDSIECTTSSSSNNKSKANMRKRNYDSDSSENSSTNGCTLRNNKKLKKKTRRSSVLSIDLNEEDTQIAEESEEESNQRIVTRRKSARNHQNGDN